MRQQILPDGRYELYDKIIEAYLKIIRQQKDMKPFMLSYNHPGNAFAALATQMQTRRTGEASKDAFSPFPARMEAIFEEELEKHARRDTPKERSEK
ncbi:MAG: hypothetical protein R2825_27455 [Saprospiraceae bacterium]